MRPRAVPSLRRAAALLSLAALAAGCAPPLAPDAPIEPAPSPPAVVAAAPPASPKRVASPGDALPDPTHAAQEDVRRMLARVAQARGLPIRRAVPGRVLDRGAILARIREHVAREIPPDVLVYQGEILAALGLLPAEYDFAEGMYRLLEGRIAGFYEPDDATMYLVDDLDESEATETLAHELAHALQDQSYPLGPLLKYTPGESDRLAAVHALAEGDATSAMLDVVAGSAFNIDEAVLRKLVAISTAFSSVGDTPRALQESLGAPYTDGFALVQALRRKGGWPAVDAVWRSPPQTTEQLLHLDKLASREPAIPVPIPDVTPSAPASALSTTTSWESRAPASPSRSSAPATPRSSLPPAGAATASSSPAATSRPPTASPRLTPRASTPSPGASASTPPPTPARPPS